MSDIDERLARVERTLGTLITWLNRDLGDHGVRQLLAILEPARPVARDPRREPTEGGNA
jgi:hypothetical protein